MKRIHLIVMFLMMYMGMYAQSQRGITISFKNMSIKEAIHKLDKQLGDIDFSYSSQLADMNSVVDKNYKDISLEQLLTDLLANTTLSYKRVGRTIVLLSKSTTKQPRRSVSGYIYDKNTGESLIGASIALSDYTKGVISNVYGFYSISMPSGISALVVKYVGYKAQVVEIGSAKRKNIYLVPNENMLMEVEVEDTQEPRHAIAGAQTISVQSIKDVPQLLGEPDIIKALQVQPGIKTVTDGSSFYYVRGGNFDQNLVLLDEAPLYNPSHIMGLVSVINGDAIKSSQFYKGYFPAQYSGKLSSVLDVNTKDGNNQTFHANAAISTIGVRATAEGPLVKDKVSYLLSLRKSWVDVVIKALKADKDIIAPAYYDVNAKLNWRVDANNKLYVSIYRGNDRMRYDRDEVDVKWYNSTASLRWNHIYNAKLFANTSFVYNRFKSSIKVSELNKPWIGSIDEGRLKHKINYYMNDKHSLVAGVKVGWHQFAPGKQKDSQMDIGRRKLLSADVFVEHEAQLGEHWKLNYGANMKLVTTLDAKGMVVLNQAYEVVPNATAKTQTWLALEPRVNVNYAINAHHNAFVSYSRMNQYHHSLYPYQNDFDIFKMWVPVSNNVKPMQSDIFSAGYGYASEHFSWGIEAYYKQIRKQLEYTAYPDLQSVYYERYLRAGKGYSFGAEFNMGYVAERYQLQFNYAYSQTKLTTPDVNGGEEHVSKYDIPHQINIVGKYNMSKRWQLSVYWKFASGKPFTLPVGTQMVNGGTEVIPIYGKRYNARFFNYHRLDIMCTLLPSDKPKKLKGTLSFGVMNAYGKDNPITIAYRYSFTTLKPESQVLFRWFPMISYQIKL